MPGEKKEVRVDEIEDNIDNIYKTLRNHGEELSNLKYAFIMLERQLGITPIIRDDDSDDDECIIDDPFSN